MHTGLFCLYKYQLARALLLIFMRFGFRLVLASGGGNSWLCGFGREVRCKFKRPVEHGAQVGLTGKWRSSLFNLRAAIRLALR